LISYEKQNPTTIFIQLLRTEKNWKKNTEKEEKKSYLNVVASEAEKRKKNKFIKYINLKKLQREKKKGEEDIHEHGEEEKKLRREEKWRERKGCWCFLHKRKKKKGGPYVVKWGILSFLLEGFTYNFTDE